MRALAHADGRAKDAEIPADLEESARSYREKLSEAAAETDDDLLAKYLEEGAIGEEEMLGALRRAIMSGGVVPVLCASATRGIGVGSLLDLIVKEFPSPADQGEVEGADPRTKATVKRAPDAKAPLCAIVFKTITDPHVGKLSVFRVYSGTLRADSQVYNASRDSRERIGHLGWLSGKTQKAVDALGPGEIGVVAKLKDTLTGDTLCDEEQPGRAARHQLPGAGHLLRDPAEDPRRRGQDLDRAPPHGRGGSDPAPPLRSRDQATAGLRAWASSTSRSWSSG